MTKSFEMGNAMKNVSKKTAYAVALAGTVIFGSMITGVVAVQAQTASTAKSPVNLSSDVKIERVERDAAGKERTVLRDPKNVVIVPGDNVVFTLSVVNSGAVAASGFRATNPIPDAVTFVGVSEDWAEVSVDKGTTWGRLGSLSVKEKATDTGMEQSRAAGPQDVTHVRWVFADAVAPNSTSSISYRGVVK